jgi:hypothetical protein
LPPSLPEAIGKYTIERFIESGGMGDVYLARDPALDRAVAIKFLREGFDNQEMRERFEREARAAGQLLHPHIVAVFDAGRAEGRPYIASAFVPGRSLDRVLAELPEGQTMPRRQAVELARKLAEALAYAHKNGVVHRDVKPGNVMLRDDGEPLLMDFGLAARADEERMTLDGQFLGTPQYTAPEQWQGQAGPASDQYSLGCLLFELLCGRPPFAGGGDVEHYLFLHLHQPAPSPRAFRREQPRDLETVVLKCLEKEPGRRYGDCQALADDLRRWLEGEPIAARRAGPVERAVKWARRNPAVAALTAVVALLLVAGVVVSTAFAIRAGEESRRADSRADEADRERGLARQATVKEVETRKDAEKQAMAAREQAYRADSFSHALLLEPAVRALVDHRDAARGAELLSLCPTGMEKTWEHRHVLGSTGGWRPSPSRDTLATSAAWRTAATASALSRVAKTER